jgi:hypothetical protein
MQLLILFFILLKISIQIEKPLSAIADIKLIKAYSSYNLFSKTNIEVKFTLKELTAETISFKINKADFPCDGILRDFYSTYPEIFSDAGSFYNFDFKLHEIQILPIDRCQGQLSENNQVQNFLDCFYIQIIHFNFKGVALVINIKALTIAQVKPSSTITDEPGDYTNFKFTKTKEDVQYYIKSLYETVDNVDNKRVLLTYLAGLYEIHFNLKFKEFSKYKNKLLIVQKHLEFSEPYYLESVNNDQHNYMNNKFKMFSYICFREFHYIQNLKATKILPNDILKKAIFSAMNKIIESYTNLSINKK